MFNATQFVIDKVRRITQINLATGLVDFTGTSVESPQIEFTGESTDKTDAQGVLLARFDTAKGVNFSGELSLLNLNLMGAQLGSEVQVADSSKKVKGADFAILTVTDDKGTKTATLKHVPTSAPAAVYTMSEDKNISGMIEVGVDEGNAKIEGRLSLCPLPSSEPLLVCSMSTRRILPSSWWTAPRALPRPRCMSWTFWLLTCATRLSSVPVRLSSPRPRSTTTSRST